MEIEIPYGAYWSTPFAKWQGTLSHLHSIKFAAHVAKKEMLNRSIDVGFLDYGVLGITVPQHLSFQGLPWLTGMIGALGVAGPTISQVCATGVHCLKHATQEIKFGGASVALVATCDKTSNSPQVYYPEPSGPGGSGEHENLLIDNMNCDAIGKHSMLQTAENVAKRHQITTEEQHDVVLMRQEQYARALLKDNAFQKRYMSLPFEVPDKKFSRTTATMLGDEGTFKSSKERLRKLGPVLEGGSVTYAGQTHPADGNACILVTTSEKAAEITQRKEIRIRIRGFGQSRAENGYMPEAPVPAARRALENADLSIQNIKAVKTHNPFAVNDIYFSREMGFKLQDMNNYGCTLVWGHTQAPMGTRGIIELIEELEEQGGGIGLFTGCAAGDTGMAVVLEVDDV
ncbi:MAG: thiolase family protein [Pseudomonadota bacterium]|nr:thiolase family protein [Pseudomonadota bacterium]